MVADVKTLQNASVLDNIRVVFGVAVCRYFSVIIFKGDIDLRLNDE